MVLKQENKNRNWTQWLYSGPRGLGVKEAIADNAQYLMDSESFIKTE
jgi:hypothetical protein